MTTWLRNSVLVLGGVLAGAILTGRAVADNKDDTVITTIPARTAPGAPAPGVRYQYMCQTKLEIRLYDSEVQRRLNELGQQGWHLLPPMVGRAPGLAYADVFCFERAY